MARNEVSGKLSYELTTYSTVRVRSTERQKNGLNIRAVSANLQLHRVNSSNVKQNP